MLDTADCLGVGETTQTNGASPPNGADDTTQTPIDQRSPEDIAAFVARITARANGGTRKRVAAAPDTLDGPALPTEELGAKILRDALAANAKGRVNIKTLADLQHKVFPDLKELVPGLIVEGCLMLAGRPKLGKSWMTLDVGLAVAMGGKCFVDRQCVQGDVLYLALEDGDKRLQRRGSKLLPTFTGEWPANFHYATEWPRGADGLVEIEKWVTGHKEARLVVVDILAKFRTPTSGKRGAYEQDYEALSGLQHLAQKVSDHGHCSSPHPQGSGRRPG